MILVLGLWFQNPLMRLLGSTDSILPYARDYSTYILLAAPAMASSCVSAFNYGAGKYSRVKEAFRFTCSFSIAVMCVAAGLGMVLAGPIIATFVKLPPGYCRKADASS